MLIDTHCHILLDSYDEISSMIEKIKESGVERIIVNGCDLQSNIRVLDLIKRYDIVYGAIGFHPTELQNFCESNFNWLEENVNNEKIVAIGEIGLDYHYDDTDIDKQKKIFKRQLDIASKYNKPIIVHTRDAIQDTYDILKKRSEEFWNRSSSLCWKKEIVDGRYFITNNKPVRNNRNKKSCNK